MDSDGGGGGGGGGRIQSNRNEMIECGWIKGCGPQWQDQDREKARGGGDIRGQILYLLPQSISNMAHRYDMLELLFLVLLIR